MHTYASDSIDRRLAPWGIAICAVGTTYLYWMISRNFRFSLPWWFETPSIMLVYGLLHWAYDLWLWKLKLPGFSLSMIPNCTGTWYGIVRSSYEGDTAIEGMLVVYQTWSRLLVEFRSESSTSYSRMASFNVTPGASQGLIYEFTNDPRADAKETMHAHRGFTFIKLSADGQRLEGDYYTGRDRSNFGTIRMRLVSKKRLDLQDAKKEHSRLEGIAE